jgi:uncharacterized membrane protein YjgN (DUF898 family)
MDARTQAGIEAFPLQFTGAGGEYFRVWIVNVLLSIVTLGFYTPFARRRTAQYFYGHTDVAGSPLEFTAQKRKMLFGFLVLVGLIIIRNLAVQTGQDTTVAILMLAGAALAPYLWASAMRFRLSATRWRGLRLQFTPSWLEVYKASWPVFAIALAWMGVSFAFGAMVGEMPIARPGRPPAFPHVPAVFWLSPVAALVVTFMCIVRLEFNYKSLLVLRAHIGGEAGRWKPVFSDFLRTWLATIAVLLVSIVLVAAIITALVLAMAGGASLLKGARPGAIGIVVFFVLLPLVTLVAAVLVSSPARAYREARMFQLIWNNVGVSRIARFKCDLKPATYVRLRIRNVLLTLVTLGFWRPFARVSEHRMKTESVTLHVKGGLDQLMGQLARQQQGGVGDAIADAVGLDLVG